MGRSVGRTARGGRWVEGEFAHGTASGRGGRASVWVGARLGLDVGRQFEGEHIPIGPPNRFFSCYVSMWVDLASAARKIKKPLWASLPGRLFLAWVAFIASLTYSSGLNPYWNSKRGTCDQVTTRETVSGIGLPPVETHNGTYHESFF